MTDIILNSEIRSEPRQGCSLLPFPFYHLASAVKQAKEGKD